VVGHHTLVQVAGDANGALPKWINRRAVGGLCLSETRRFITTAVFVQELTNKNMFDSYENSQHRASDYQIPKSQRPRSRLPVLHVHSKYLYVRRIQLFPAIGRDFRRYTWSWTGRPPGFTFDANTGTLNGTAPGASYTNAKRTGPGQQQSAAVRQNNSVLDAMVGASFRALRGSSNRCNG